MATQTILYSAKEISFKKAIPAWFSITTILLVGIVSILLAASLFVDEGQQDMELRYGRIIVPYKYIEKTQPCQRKEILIGRVPILERNCK